MCTRRLSDDDDGGELVNVLKVEEENSALTLGRNKQKRNINRSIMLMVICSVMCG